MRPLLRNNILRVPVLNQYPPSKLSFSNTIITTTTSISTGMMMMACLYQSRRGVRIVSNDASQEINFTPNSVAFQSINKQGATRRFYRQVFIREFDEKKSNVVNNDSISINDNNNNNNKDNNDNDNDNDNTDNKSYALYLDHRILILRGHPIVIDNYRLALLMASEFEMQGEYMRLESMPLTNFTIDYLFKHLNSAHVSLEFQKSCYLRTVTSHFSTDLIRIAENSKKIAEGFYEKHWQPIIDWFNQTFETNVKIEYLEMVGEPDTSQDIKNALDISKNMQGINIEETMANYKHTEIAKMMDHIQNHRVVDPSYGKLKKFLKEIDLLRAWVLDDMIHHFNSSIIAIAILLNAITLESALAAINCPELDTQLIHESEDNLKLNETLLRVAACRSFLNLMDETMPMPFNSIAMPYDKPVIDLFASTPLLQNSQQSQQQQHQQQHHHK